MVCVRIKGVCILDVYIEILEISFKINVTRRGLKFK